MTTDIVPELLRGIQGDIASLRNEILDGSARVETRLGLIKHGLADVLKMSVDRDEVLAFKARVDETLENRMASLEARMVSWEARVNAAVAETRDRLERIEAHLGLAESSRHDG
jgi:hypothetical protein